MSQCRGGRTSLVALMVVVTLMWAASAAHAITIVIDYTHDTYFSSNATAKAAVDAAATDLSYFIGTSLNAMSDQNTGQSGASSMTLGWEFLYQNPSTGDWQTYAPSAVGADNVVIFAGVRGLASNTLGQGGPGGFGTTGGSYTYTNDTQFTQAVAQLGANADANLSRGDGPVIFDAAFDLDIEGGVYPVGFNVGLGVGHLWFNDPTVQNYWHFDHTASVEAGKYDLYTVALHEMLHALGLGASASWNALVDGTNWLGSSVADLLGSGAGAVSPDGSHIASSLQSYDLVNGDLQYTVMGPTLAAGERRYLTELDAAFLADIGWSVIPEPGTVSLVLLGAGVLLWRRRSTAVAG